jgi:hypothetical protein
VSLELHRNDVSREAKPSLWIFSGAWVALLPASVLAGLCIARILMAAYLDWWLIIPIACLPFVGAVVFVHFFVNARPPSFFMDLAFLMSWRFRTWLYMHSCLYRPPLLWLRPKSLPHPTSF